MHRLGTRHLTPVLIAAAVAVAACGSSSKTTTSAKAPTPATSSTASVPTSVVAEGNAPVKLAFDSAGYPAACQKSLETPNSKGHAFTHGQAKTMCGCLQQKARAKGLSSESEESITVKQFASLFKTCVHRVRGGA